MNLISNTAGGRQQLVSIVIPFFNEGKCVQNFFNRLFPVLNQIKSSIDLDYELICVDDGSTDDTLVLLLSVAKSYKSIKVVELSRNFGKEAALTAGIDSAVGDAVIPIDCDLQDPPELIPKLIERWLLGFDVVLAKKDDRLCDSCMKRWTAHLFYRLHNLVSDTQIPEGVGDFRLMNRAAVDALKRMPERQRFMKGLFSWVGFKTDVVLYKREPRTSGASKFSGWKLWNFALEGFTSFSTSPLRMWTYIGGAATLISLAYALYIVFRTLIQGIDLPGYASLLVAILFLGGLQLLSIGLLGEYIGRIYMESKGRPIYIVRNNHG